MKLRGSMAAERPPVTIVGRGGGGPVVLATLAVPFDMDAARVAVQAALETNVKLIVLDAVERPWWPQALATRHADLEEAEDRDQICRFASQVAALGLEVEHLRVPSPKPVEALLEVVAERRAGLLVLGPDRSRFKPRRFARMARRVRRRASCLLWVAGEGP
jgi:nucleotide-binding universal stress UspA family protein